MFVTRALAATAVAGLAFGLSAPIAFAQDTTPAPYGQHYGSHKPDPGSDSCGQGDKSWGGGHDQSSSGDQGKSWGGDNNQGQTQSQSQGGQTQDQAQGGQNRAGSWGNGGDHDKGSKHCHPSQGADTGLGGSITGMNSTQTALGGGLLVAAVAGSGVYLKRRRPGATV